MGIIVFKGGNNVVIKVIDEISNKKGIGIIEANKIRMKKIQDNIKDFNLVDNLFVDLEVSILKGDIDGLKNVISKKLYFEEIDGLEFNLINSYKKQRDKKMFIEALKKSYMIRGVKGVHFAWMPIILK